MSTRRTDDGTYPDVEEELEKLEERARASDDDVPGPYRAVADAERAAREPLETEHDDEPAPIAAVGGDLELLIRRAEVRVDPIYIEGPSSEVVSFVLEDFADGSSEIVVLALDGDDAELELARMNARAFFGAIDRLRAFGVDPNPPRERTVGDVHAALEGLVRDAGPAVVRALGLNPLRPVPGGKR
jgi:hypothetical protein